MDTSPSPGLPDITRSDVLALQRLAHFFTQPDGTYASAVCFVEINYTHSRCKPVSGATPEEFIDSAEAILDSADAWRLRCHEVS